VAAIAADHFRLLSDALEKDRAAGSPPLGMMALRRRARAAYPVKAKEAFPRRRALPKVEPGSYIESIERERTLLDYIEEIEAADRAELEQKGRTWNEELSSIENDSDVRSAIKSELANLAVFAALPEELAGPQIEYARLLALRFFGGRTLFEIATRDNRPLKDLKRLWAEAREWVATTAHISTYPANVVLLDPIDRQALASIAATPALLHAVDWRTFEKVLAAVLGEMEYEIELRRGTKDGGIDIVAIKRQGPFGPHRYLVQAKRWKHRVGVAPVRELLYLKHEIGATKAILATTSRFTSGASAIAREHWWELELRDFAGLSEWLQLIRKP